LFLLPFLTLRTLPVAGLARTLLEAALMKTFLRLSRRRHWHVAALIATLITARAHAGSTCPNWVETPAGSAFNVAAVISDNGSPKAALAKIRVALSQMNAVGGCKAFGNSVACNETVALAHKAIAALEECTSVPGSQGTGKEADVQ
jgi:hypothetical protein